VLVIGQGPHRGNRTRSGPRRRWLNRAEICRSATSDKIDRVRSKSCHSLPAKHRRRRKHMALSRSVSGSCTQALPYRIAAAYLLRITQSGSASMANISAAVPSKRPFIFAKIRRHVAISGVSLKSSNFSEPPITTASRRGKTYP